VIISKNKQIFLLQALDISCPGLVLFLSQKQTRNKENPLRQPFGGAQETRDKE